MSLKIVLECGPGEEEDKPMSLWDTMHAKRQDVYLVYIKTGVQWHGIPGLRKYNIIYSLFIFRQLQSVNLTGPVRQRHLKQKQTFTNLCFLSFVIMDH